MSMNEEDQKLLGRLEAHAENTKEGITEIKSSIKDLTRVTGKAHDKIDDVSSSLKSHKAKVNGFAAAISAVWAIVFGFIKGD